MREYDLLLSALEITQVAAFLACAYFVVRVFVCIWREMAAFGFWGATKRSMDISVNWRNRDVRWMLITGVATQVLMWVIQAVKDH